MSRARENSNIRIVLYLSAFAIAMAYFEAALVVHLRSVYYPTDPRSIFPLHLLSHRDLVIEVGRETATMIMLVSVALLAERSMVRRFAAFVYLFGLWDLGYYAWLKVFIDWPQSWREWDVLFLIPWPWMGPWLTPAVIAALLLLWGGYVLLSASVPQFTRLTVAIFLLGSILVLIAFLAPAMPLLARGEEAFRNYRPASFSWTLYLTGFLLLSASLIATLRRRAE